MLYRNLIIFIILIQSFNIMVYGQEKYMPGPRTGHIAVYIEPELKIYYIGGYSPYNLLSEKDKPDPESDFFYLNHNHSKPDDIWVDLKSQGVKLPYTFGHTANIGGINQDSIFIIGGVHLLDEKNTNYLYKFDIKTYELSVPVIQGIAPQTRIRMDSVSYEGKIYLFGGRTYMLDESKSVYISSFDIFDTVNLNWQVGSLINSPVTSSGYTATLVNGFIYYIGGRSQQNVFHSMTDIYLYDTFGDAWSVKKAIPADIKATPGSRVGHSAVLYDGKIFVYGGLYFNSETSHDIAAKGIFVMLDIVTLVWSIPPLNDTNVPILSGHTATLINESVMVVAFGDLMDSPTTIENNLTYVFHLEDPNYKWSKFFSSGTTMTTTTTSSSISIQTRPTDTSYTENPDTASSSSTKMSKTIIVGISVGLVVVVLAILATCSLAYKRIKRKQMKTNRESSQLNGQGVFNGVEIQVPSDNDKYSMHLQYSPVHQQFASQQLQSQHSVTRMTPPPIQQHPRHSDLSISPSPQGIFF